MIKYLGFVLVLFLAQFVVSVVGDPMFTVIFRHPPSLFEQLEMFVVIFGIAFPLMGTAGKQKFA